MLRLIGALVVILLILGPLLQQVGLLDNAGLVRDMVDLEVKAFADLVDLIRGLINGHP